jgi:hypothetical protein
MICLSIFDGKTCLNHLVEKEGRKKDMGLAEKKKES